MVAVADSGPLISLAAADHFERLCEQLGEILIIPDVEREVITEGRGRAGEKELRTAIAAGWAKVTPVRDLALATRLARSTLSDVDVAVIVCAIENGRLTVVADDGPLRRACIEEQLPLVGSVGLLIRARRDGTIPALKPVLDRMIANGFRLDPAGAVYADALRSVGEVA